MLPRSRITAILFPVACAALIAFGYGEAVHSYFSSDDWLMLWYYGRMPVTEPWRFFSPQVVWFYRPLQSLQFGLFYTWFHLNPLPYNLALLLLHGLGVMGVYLLGRELDSRPRYAEGVTLFFLAQWAYVDVLLWKSNLNTLQWAVLTLGSAVCFLKSLRTGRRVWRVAAFTLGGLAFLAKEMAVNGPLLLLLLWAYRDLTSDDLRGPSLRGALCRAVMAVWPAVAIAAVYVLFHRLGVRDVAEDKTGYHIVSAPVALEQMGIIYNHLFLSIWTDPLRARGLGLSLAVRVGGALVLPLLLVLLGWRLRDRLLFLGTAWVLVAYLPVVLLKDFHASRFYYLAAVGAAIVIARGAVLLAKWAAGRSPGIRASTLGVVGLLLLYWVGVSVLRVRQFVHTDVCDATRVRALFLTLERARGTVEPGALVVLENAPRGSFGSGFGVREFVRLGLNDDTLEGVMQGQPLPADRLAKLQTMKVVYSLDAGNEPQRVVRVR